MIDRRTCPYSGRTVIVLVRRWWSTDYWHIPCGHGPISSRRLPAPRLPAAHLDRRDRHYDKRKRSVQALRPRVPRPKLLTRGAHTVRVPRMIREMRTAAGHPAGKATI